jgi:hypothetical protein
MLNCLRAIGASIHSPTVLPHHGKLRNAPSLRRTGICRPRPSCHPLEPWAPWHLLQPTRRMRAALQLCGPARHRHAILLSHSALLLGRIESYSASVAGERPPLKFPGAVEPKSGGDPTWPGLLRGHGLGVKPSGPWRYATVRP